MHLNLTTSVLELQELLGRQHFLQLGCTINGSIEASNDLTSARNYNEQSAGTHIC